MKNWFIPGLRTIVTDLDHIPIEELVRDCNIPRLILWERAGLFRLIPRPIVANIIDNYTDWLKRENGSRFTFSVRWDQGIDLDPKIARTLLGE